MSEHPHHLPPRGERWLLLATTIVGALAALIGACAGCGSLLVNQ
ncbi:hypothetical protein [Micromonospora pisi]|nr:hypothetical protein [Micromonospora pisi]